MPLYWARFVNRESKVFRLDTRIYLQDVAECGSTDTVLGAVVAKNPGSAQPSNNSTILQPIDLANDKLIPTVRSFVTKAYNKARCASPDKAYIQVLNLFYLCDKEFNRAIQTASQLTNPLTDAAESKSFPWIMYLWGAFEHRKSRFIRRFTDLDSENHFYFDKNLNQLVCDVPGEGSFAKYTQGLQLDPIIAHLASLIQCRQKTG